MPIFSVLARLYAYRSLVLLLLLAVCAGGAYFYYHQAERKEAEKQAIINLYTPQAPARTVDKEGRETVRIVAPVISPAVLKDLRVGLAAEIRDQLRKEFGRQATLLSAQRVETQTRQVLPTVALRDTTVRKRTPAGVVATPARAGKFKDEWLTLTGLVTDDSLSVDYTIRNEFDIRAYSKRTGKHWWYFWKSRAVFVDLKNKNPHTTTSKIEAVVVKKE